VRVLFVAPLLVTLVVTASAQGSDVVVSAASSLTDVLTELGRRFERETGVRVALNTGGSNTLARQIRAGARVDLFVSADAAQMDAVAADIVGGTRIDLLANQLAIAVPDDRVRVVDAAADLADPAFRRIAIGDPAAVPAGVYARAYLEQLGLWERLLPKVVPTGTVRLALAAVESGAADAAIVYRTDLAAARRARAALIVPRDQGPAIIYPAAIIGGGRNREGARRLLAFLRGGAAADVFRRAGFIPLPAPSFVEGP